MYQSITIVGRLGATPEMRYSANGNAVTTFRVAVDNGRGEDKTTEWFRIVTFKGTAEACAQYLDKGSLVLVQGRMQTRSWDDQQGVKRYMTELVADRVQFLDSRGSREHADIPAPAGGDIDPDDLPFHHRPENDGWQEATEATRCQV